MKNRILAVTLIFAMMVCLVLSGCTEASEATINLSGERTHPEFETEYYTDYSDKYTDFSARLFKECCKDGKNTLVSPLSVTLALAMLTEGAEGKTLEETEAMFDMKLSELRNFSYYYISSKSDDSRLKIADSLWVNSKDGFSVNEEFLEANSDYHQADVFKSLFSNKTLEEINAWANEKTDGMIPKAMDKLEEDSVMCLVNALLFDASWARPYDKHSVREGEFIASDGTVQKAEFMHSTEGVFLADKNATGFLKYYEDFDYGFAALLPNEGVSVEEYVSTLSGKGINALLSDYEETTVITSMPKFESGFGASLNEALINLGMESAFDAVDADYSRLGTLEDGNIYLGEVSHKTKIFVAEKGTKAGAVTVETVRATGAIADPKQVHLDRPFVYMLVDMESKLPMFIGVLNSLEG